MFRNQNILILILLLLQILFDNQKRANGVVFERFGREYVAHSSKEVIVSTGALNTPQLLMLSGIGPREHLEKFNVRKTNI